MTDVLPDRTIRLWDAGTGQQVRRIDDVLYVIALSPDGKVLAASGSGPRIVLRDARTGKPIRTLEWEERRCRALEFSPDGRRLVSADEDRPIRI